MKRSDGPELPEEVMTVITHVLNKLHERGIVETQDDFETHVGLMENTDEAEVVILLANGAKIQVIVPLDEPFNYDVEIGGDDDGR